MPTTISRGGCGVVLALALGACLVDPDARCGPDQDLDARGVCVCRPEYARGATNCVACGEHEQPAGDHCACVDGFAPDDAGLCAPIPEGQGAACDALVLCETTSDPLCHDPGVDGYCTHACAVPADCTSGYACDLAAVEPYCVRPPLGLGDVCASSEDCVAEADYCETLQSHTCQVSGCALASDDCFIGWACCDLTSFGLAVLCVPEGMCPT